MREISADGGESPELKKIGPYEVIRLLGRGGMGEVYRARKLGEVVAAKVLAPELIGDSESVARFNREANAIAAVKHPNIARVLDHGVTDEGRPYLIMEFIDGPSLADLIRNRVELPYSKIARLMTEAALGLQAAFSQKIIHRDIKPANMMLDATDTLKIVDFGLAKNLFENTFKTATGTVLGTPRYMSPEQGRGQSLDHRSDMYSLGCSFYHLAAGQPPFEADTSLALMMKHIQTPLTPIYVVNPHVPADLAECLHRLLAKDPGDRFQEYDDLIAELRQIELARRSKEEGSPARGGEATVVDGYAQTSLFAANAAREGAPPGAAPAARLRHTAVLESSTPAEPVAGASGVRILMFAVIAVALLGAGLALSRKTEDESGRKRSGWAVLVSKMLGTGKDIEEKKSAKEQNALMIANQQRMQYAMNACARYQTKQGEFPKSVQEVVDADVGASADDLKDSWGRSFEIFPSSERLASYGPDGEQSTGDDYLLERNGTWVSKPAEVKENDLTNSEDWSLGKRGQR